MVKHSTIGNAIKVTNMDSETTDNTPQNLRLFVSKYDHNQTMDGDSSFHQRFVKGEDSSGLRDHGNLLQSLLASQILKFFWKSL